MTAEMGKFVVYVLHKVTEVQAQFVVKFQSAKKQIHKPGFTAAYITPQIQTYPILAIHLLMTVSVIVELVEKSLQLVDNLKLRGVMSKEFSLRCLVVFFDDAHDLNVPEF